MEETRKPDLWPIIYPTPHPGHPSQSEMGRWGISLGSRAWGRRCEQRDWQLRNAGQRRRRPPPPVCSPKPRSLSGSLTWHGPRTGWAKGICVPRSHQQKTRNCAGMETSQFHKLTTVWSFKGQLRNSESKPPSQPPMRAHSAFYAAENRSGALGTEPRVPLDFVN